MDAGSSSRVCGGFVHAVQELVSLVTSLCWGVHLAGGFSPGFGIKCKMARSRVLGFSGAQAKGSVSMIQSSGSGGCDFSIKINQCLKVWAKMLSEFGFRV